MLFYKPVSEILYHTDLGAYHSFGIEILQGEKRILFVADISTDRESVVKLAEICSQFQPSIIHFYDIVDDFLIRTFVARQDF